MMFSKKQVHKFGDVGNEIKMIATPISENPQMIELAEVKERFESQLAETEKKIRNHYEGPGDQSTVTSQSIDADAVAIIGGMDPLGLGGDAPAGKLAKLIRAGDALRQALKVTEAQKTKLVIKLSIEMTEKLDDIATEHGKEIIDHIEAAAEAIKRAEVFNLYVARMGYLCRSETLNSDGFERAILFGGNVPGTAELYLERRRKIFGLKNN